MIAVATIARARAAIQAVSIEAVHEEIDSFLTERMVKREEREHRRGRPRAVNCFSCGRFKPRPSSICGFCGDDPVSYSQGNPDSCDRLAFDEAHYGERVL